MGKNHSHPCQSRRMGHRPKHQLCSEQPSGTDQSVSQHRPSGILSETGESPQALRPGKAAKSASKKFAENFGE